MPDSFGIPDRINRLEELAYNFWWSWHLEPRVLFENLDPTLWKETHHNPVAILRDIKRERLEEVSEDPQLPPPI